MEDQNFGIKEISSKLESKHLLILLFFAGIFVFAVGIGLVFFRSQNAEDDIKIISQTNDVTEAGEIYVHVDGAVSKPGLYKLKPDARVNDAVSVAGGFSDDAQVQFVNLALKVSDGQKVYIPKLGESVKGVSAIAGDGAGVEAGGLVNINSASSAALESLPGIGPVTAGKIINGRPYSSVEELLSRKIVGRSTFEKIKALVAIH